MWRMAALGALGAGTCFVFPLLDTELKFYYQDSPITSSIIKSCPSLAHGKFFPTPWLPNGVLQGYFATSKGSLPGDSAYGKHIEYRRELVVLPDGGTMSIDWALPDNGLDAGTKTAMVLHGVTGDSNSQYIRNIVKAAQDKGYRVGVIQNRGINGTPLTTPKTTHAGMTEDFAYLLAQIKTRFPSAPLVGIGCSMGGNLLLKYAGESGEKCVLTALVAVAPPYNILTCSRHLATNIPTRMFADQYLNKNFRKLLKQNEELLKPLEATHGVDIAGALNTTRTWEFDELFTRRLHGFASPEDYYDKASCFRYIERISIPTMSLSALDDPVIPASCIPYEAFRKNPNTILVVTRTGGHIGWFEGLQSPQRWYPKPTLEFLDYVIDSKAKQL